MIKQLKIVIAMVLTIMFFGITGADACTYFFLKTKDNAIISGRTDEFYAKLDSKIQLVPRGIAFKSTAPEGAKAISWKTKYGFIGISAMHQNMFAEGMNEKGLAAGGLFFDDIKYPTIATGDDVIHTKDFVGWILGNFQNIEELKLALSRIKMWSDTDNPFHKPLPMHMYVTDATGNSVVLEYIDGKMKIWDNRENGVLTNEPDLGWHLTNMRFYSHIKPMAFFSPEISNEDAALGSGTMGIPGDYSCAARFVRTSLLKSFSKQPKDAESGVNLALHIINAIDIPYGPQVWIQGQEGNIQWTVWSVIYDQTNKHFYYRTYENPTLRRFDLSKLDFGEGTPRKEIDIFVGSGYEDDTKRLANPK